MRRERRYEIPNVWSGCAPCKGAVFQWVQGPPGNSLQPEAAGAVMEATKWLKPSECGLRIGSRASVQAATRVNAERVCHTTGSLAAPEFSWGISAEGSKSETW